MKTLNTSARVALVAAMGLMASVAQAALTTATAVFISGPANGPSAAQVAAALGLTEEQLGDQVYKANAGVTVTEEGDAAGYYTTVYNPPPQADAADGTITISWDGPMTIAATALVVKDGSWGHWVWNISSWDGKSDIVIMNPYPGNGATSNVQIYGAVVPEPSTYIAGGLALLPLLFGLRSRFAKKA